MAAISGKDVTAVTFNSQDLKAFVTGIDGLSQEAVTTDYRAPGSASKTSKLTGQITDEDVTITFILDTSATGPAVKAALSTAATLTFTLNTGISVTGTANVVKIAAGIPEEGLDTIAVTFRWDGGATWDLAA